MWFSQVGCDVTWKDVSTTSIGLFAHLSGSQFCRELGHTRPRAFGSVKSHCSCQEMDVNPTISSECDHNLCHVLRRRRGCPEGVEKGNEIGRNFVEEVVLQKNRN